MNEAASFSGKIKKPIFEVKGGVACGAEWDYCGGILM